MKKLSLGLLGALMLSQAALAAPGAFDGFYLGAQLGYTQRNHKIAAGKTPMLEATREALTKNKKVNGMTYGLYTGYGQNNTGFYWGGEFNIEHSTANKKLNCDHDVTRYVPAVPLALYRPAQPAYMTKDKINVEYTYERGLVFALAPRLGAVIANDNLIYAKLGMEVSRDTLTAKVSTRVKVTETKASKTKVVFVPGVGYERVFGKILARVEYGYNLGGKVNDAKYSAHVIKTGLAYKF